ncbi:flavin reductase like protein [Nitzschia inconspicua]|uniref:Flavin reductase like protein n=1 Tax=Nitzschia inconspicua TaxID=303405 RepID=A0A9K3KY80_9STRA|nr:flavin reductase like protein [Nitzschia inconspicua]
MSSTTADSAPSQSSSEWTSVNPDNREEISVPALYHLCISSIVPRPVAVITTKDPETGIVNCAPYSYSSLSGHDPPIVTHGLTVGRATGKKDTLRNIEASGEWVMNVLTTSYLDKANGCAATLPYNQDETQLVGLEVLNDCTTVNVPRLKDAPVAMEVKLLDKKEIKNVEGRHTNTVVIGQVTKFHIHKNVLKEGQPADEPRVDLVKLQAVGRAGDITYWPVGTTPETIRPIERPS